MKFYKYYLALIFIFLTCTVWAKPVELNVIQTHLLINGREAKIFKIEQPPHVWQKGHDFNVLIKNSTSVPITLHWHGLIVPNKDDGVPYVTQLPLMPGKTQHVKFLLKQSGTYWMHSHYSDQIQYLMAAPLIIESKRSLKEPVKNVVVLAQDYIFKTPQEVFASLRKGAKSDMKPMNVKSTKSMNMGSAKTMDMKSMHMQSKNSMNMESMQTMNMPDSQNTHKMTMKMGMGNKPDLFDFKVDALLANHRTLANPEVVRVKPGSLVRLRLINGAFADNMYIQLPAKMQGELIATDGEPIEPYYNNKFQFPIANRFDIIVHIPNRPGVYPIFFQAVGRKLRTGIILATPNMPIPKFSSLAKEASPGYTYAQDFKMHALHPLSDRKPNRTLIFHLNGNMMDYRWGINGQYWPHVKPTFIREGDRVKMIIINDTGMTHPMHFHGHFFQLVSINGVKLNGFEGDTVSVLPHSRVSVIFDADDPGIWPFHCHLLYHQMAGMFTTINYFDYPPPSFYLKKIGMTKQQYQKLADRMIHKKIEP